MKNLSVPGCTVVPLHLIVFHLCELNMCAEAAVLVDSKE